MSVSARTSLIVILSLALAACAGWKHDRGRQVHQAASLDASGVTDFERHLHDEYIAFAKHELNEQHYEAADQMAARAADAANGVEVLPEPVGARVLPAEFIAPAIKSRRRLMSVFERGARERMPQEAAVAQVMFDCWMEEQEEDFQPEDISRCQAKFDEMVSLMENNLPQLAVAAVPPPAPPPMPGPYTILFEFDGDEITEQAQADINRIAADASAHSPSKIFLDGHTDRAGSDDYNIGLSQRRADSVERALATLGVPPAMMQKSRFGESQPKIPTPDGQREAANRRVEVRFERQ